MERTSGTSSRVTRKMRLFVEAYITCWNGARAAREVGYAFPDRAAVRLLNLPNIQDEIAERMKVTELQTDEVLSRLGQQARLNPSMFFIFAWVPILDVHKNPKKDTNGEIIKEYKMIDVDWEVFEKYGYLVKKLSYDRKGNPVIEFHDAQNALMLIGRAQKLFVDRVDSTNINVAVSADDMAAARAKAQEFEQSLLSNSNDQ